MPSISNINSALAHFFGRFLSVRLFAIFLAGVLLSFIQAPYNYWFLLFPAFGIFYLLYTQAQNKKQAFASGFLFAFGYFVFGLYWIGNALLVEGNEDFVWVWPLAVVALPAALSMFTALYVTIAFILFKRLGRSGFIGLCVLMAVAEWVRGYAFTGFPWNLYGYGWLPVLPVAQFASVMGPYGLTLLTILWGVFAGFVLHSGVRLSQKASLGAGLAVLFVAVFAFGYHRLDTANVQSNPDVNIRIIQPNIDQSAKWQVDQLLSHFNKQIELSAPQAGPISKRNIIVWPETAIPPTFLQSRAVQERIEQVLGPNDLLLAGALDVTRDFPSGAPEYHNSLVSWQKNGEYRRLYSKSHLVPFGEYIPFQKYIPLKTVTNFSGFQRGEGPRTVSSIEGFPSFSPLICYEVIFPHKAVSKDQLRPDYILTVTNDGWYGQSLGPYQHFVQAQFRAIEQGLPVIRAANTGVSGVIDPYGRIVEKSELLQQTTINQPLIARIEASTPYNKHGDYLFLWSILLGLITAILFKKKHFS